MAEVTALVLAAGKSVRFGRENKLLREWRGRPLVTWVVDALVEAGLQVIVVTGPENAEIAAVCPSARPVVNQGPDSGLGGSLVAGVLAAPEGHGLLVALGDMPGLRADVVREVLVAYRPDSIVVPVYASEPDRFGHPVLFGAAFRNELLAVCGDTGARSVIAANSPKVVRVPVTGGLKDVDTPEDLASLG